VTSPRKEKAVSTTIVNAFLSEYGGHVRDVIVERLDIWQERLPEFDADAVNAQYKGGSVWKSIRCQMRRIDIVATRVELILFVAHLRRNAPRLH
jgi:FMN-dependent NADH-azoreductase